MSKEIRFFEMLITKYNFCKNAGKTEFIKVITASLIRRTFKLGHCDRQTLEMPPNNKPIWAMNTRKSVWQFSIISMQVCYVSVNVDAALLRMSEFDYDLPKDKTYIVLFSELFLLSYSSTFFTTRFFHDRWSTLFPPDLSRWESMGFQRQCSAMDKREAGKRTPWQGPPTL